MPTGHEPICAPRVHPLAILLGALILVTPAILNHGPFLSPDCAVYFGYGRDILHALAHPVAQRPPITVRSEFYDLADFSLGLGRSFWPITMAAALITSWFLALTLRTLLKPTTLNFIAAIVALAALTPLAWFTSYAMPDIFSGIVVLGIFLTTVATLTLRERLATSATTTFAITTHPTYFPIAVILCLTLVALLLIRRESLRALRTTALVVLTAAFAQILIHTYLYRSPSISGQTAPFLAARLLADGAAQRTLTQLCPTTHWELCNHLGHLPNNDTDFLWSPGSIWQTANPTQRHLILAQQLPLARATLRLHGREQLRISAHNIWDVLTTPSLDEFGFLPITVSWLEPVLPGAGARYLASPQAHSAFPIATLTTIVRAIATMCAVACVPLLVLAHRRRAFRAITFAALTITALLTNAVLCGAISGVYSRYESRLIWLLPLTTFILAGAAWGRTSRAQSPDPSPMSPSHPATKD